MSTYNDKRTSENGILPSSADTPSSSSPARPNDQTPSLSSSLFPFPAGSSDDLTEGVRRVRRKRELRGVGGKTRLLGRISKARG